MKIKRPNHTQIPNIIIDEVMKDLTPAEFKVFIVICRKTLGWHKLSDQISISQFMDLTKLSNKGVINAQNSLASKGLIKMDKSKGLCTEFTIAYEESSQVTNELSSHTKETPINKYNYIQFVDLWNELFNTRARITDGKRAQIKARLKTFTEEEIKKALHNRSKSDKLLSPTNWDAFWRNDEYVEGWLNKGEKKQQQIESWKL